jgi:hypothetical protein
MKKTLVILVLILFVTVIVTKAQSSINSTSKKEIRFLTELSVNPSHFSPTNLRGGVGLKIDKDNMSTELIVSYEYFNKSENQLYRGIDFSVIRLSNFKNHQKLSAGIGLKLGGVIDYGPSLGSFIKGEYRITNFFILSGQLGFAGAQRWGYYCDRRINLIFKFF